MHKMQPIIDLIESKPLDYWFRSRLTSHPNDVWSVTFIYRSDDEYQWVMQSFTLFYEPDGWSIMLDGGAGLDCSLFSESFRQQVESFVKDADNVDKAWILDHGPYWDTVVEKCDDFALAEWLSPIPEGK